MTDLTVVPLNVRGIRSRDWIKVKHKADIVCLQETHSTLADEKLWEDDWGGKIAFNHGESNSSGVCAL